MAWTNRVIFPGIYNVSNGLTVIWLFGQFRWLSCNKLALFSDLSEYYHLLGALLELSLWGAMYEHLRVVPPGKRLRVPSCTRPEILGSG